MHHFTIALIGPLFALAAGLPLAARADAAETYAHQEDTQQTVRVWGDTAVVTALLWIKGANKDGAYDDKLWFSDTYVRTAKGWRYVFGQASIRLPEGTA